MAGGALNHRKPSPAPTIAPQMHREFARALARNAAADSSAKTAVADEIDDEPEACRRDHHRHDGEAIEPVGDVDGIAGADHDEHADDDEEHAEVE